MTKDDNDILHEKPDEGNQTDKDKYRGSEKEHSKRGTSESEVHDIVNSII